MATLFEKQNLLYDVSSLETNSARFNQLYRDFSRISTSYVASALSIEISQLAAESWLEDAASLVGKLLLEASHREEPNSGQPAVHTDLRAGMTHELVLAIEDQMQPNAEEIKSVADRFAQATINSWVTRILRLVNSGSEVNLSFQMIPEGTQGKWLSDCIAPFPVDKTAALTVLSHLGAENASSLPEEDTTYLHLPFDLYLEPGPRANNEPVIYYVGLESMRATYPRLKRKSRVNVRPRRGLIWSGVQVAMRSKWQEVIRDTWEQSGEFLLNNVGLPVNQDEVFFEEVAEQMSSFVSYRVHPRALRPVMEAVAGELVKERHPVLVGEECMLQSGTRGITVIGGGKNLRSRFAFERGDVAISGAFAHGATNLVNTTSVEELLEIEI